MKAGVQILSLTASGRAMRRSRCCAFEAIRIKDDGRLAWIVLPHTVLALGARPELPASASGTPCRLSVPAITSAA